MAQSPFIKGHLVEVMADACEWRGYPEVHDAGVYADGDIDKVLEAFTTSKVKPSFIVTDGPWLLWSCELCWSVRVGRGVYFDLNTDKEMPRRAHHNDTWCFDCETHGAGAEERTFVTVKALTPPELVSAKPTGYIMPVELLQPLQK